MQRAQLSGVFKMSQRKVLDRKRKDDEETAHAFQEFVETFHQPTMSAKVWVKAGTYDPSTQEEKHCEESLYRPQSRLQSDAKQIGAKAQEFARILVKDDCKKKKQSNLESFKQELEMRFKAKQDLKRDDFDGNTTNLYVNFLNPCVKERQLMELFGEYGPLASVKIMWPRTEEEKNRARNSGFVAYMSPKDAERAIRYLNGKTYMDSELKVGWGKAVSIPEQPIYIPKVLLDTSPPDSGLPFNAQPTCAATSTDFNEYLANCIVKVVIPADKSTLSLIHRTVEFVIREGVFFEAMLMNRELNNPCYRFLFDNKSQDHVYYRWKLFSMLQGDGKKEWNLETFRMFQGGPIWLPPAIPDYTKGMPDELFEAPRKLKYLRQNLSEAQRKHLQNLIRTVTPQREKVCEVMVYCIEHMEAHHEIAEMICQSLLTTKSPEKIVARLYVISDIFGNERMCFNAYLFKEKMQRALPHLLTALGNLCLHLDTPSKELLRWKILQLIAAWRKLATFDIHYLDHLEKVFGAPFKPVTPPPKPKTPSPPKISAPQSKFRSSRWETVSPDVVESQAFSTIDMSNLRPQEEDRPKDPRVKPALSELERKRLREIEVKVVEYSDKLEAGVELVDEYLGIEKQVDDYRRALIKEWRRQWRDGKEWEKRKKKKSWK